MNISQSENLKIRGKHGAGKVAIVDASLAPLLRRYKWYTRPDGYVYRSSRKGRGSTIYLHREVMRHSGRDTQGLEVDHINNDKLDNRRHNLRLVTRSQNEQNQPARSARSATGYRNVYHHKGMYRVTVQLHGKTHNFGHFDDLDEAIVVAKEARRELFTHAPECEGSA